MSHVLRQQTVPTSIILLISLFITLSTSSQILSSQHLSLTIYNNNFGMIKDVRTITFDKGQSLLYFTDVAQTIQTQTVTFKSLTSPQSIKISQQNFDKNLITQNSILQKYIQKNITVIANFLEQQKTLSGILLSNYPNIILQTSSGIISINSISQIMLPSIPDGFFIQPTLNWKVFSQVPLTAQCQVAYRATGLKWKADYNLILNNNQDKVDLGGWVTIDNNSGKKYLNAKLKLIAGDVNTVSASNSTFIEYPNYLVRRFKAKAQPPSFTQQQFSDYHLYTFSTPITLNQSSSKQLQFMPKVYNISIDAYNQISIKSGGIAQSNIKALSKIRFNNSDAYQLGVPLPAGTIRVFQQDLSDNSLQFIGEDSIDHTPKNQNITLTIGTSFDIRADVSVNNLITFSNGAYIAEMNLTIINHKPKQSKIFIKYNSLHGDNLSLKWDINNSDKLLKTSSNQYNVLSAIQSNQQIVYKWTEVYRA